MRHVEIRGRDHAATAAEYDLGSRRAYGRARTEARRAAGWYKLAAQKRRHAAWLTARPDLWDLGPAMTPGYAEGEAASYTSLGDLFLHAYFRAVDRARDDAAQARFYRALAARQAAVADYS